MERIVDFDVKVKVVSYRYPGMSGRRYFRMVTIDELGQRVVGKLIVVVSDVLSVNGKLPAGYLLDVHRRYFRIKSPSTGQILCVNYCDCLGWTTVKAMMSDSLDMELQEHPERYDAGCDG